MNEDFFDWSDAGPLDREDLDATIRAVQDRLDVCVVLEKRYGLRLSVAGARWRTQCFLPSTVRGFAGTCAEQDASASNGNARPRNLWVSEGELTRVWRCHSCQRRGDVIDLIEHADGLVRNEGQVLSLRAVRAAAKLAGVGYVLDGCKMRESDVPSELVDVSAPRAVPVAKQRVVSFDAARKLNARASAHWAKQLREGPGRRAREELARRRVTPDQAKRYRIGYAADAWRDLVGELPKDAAEDASALGLVGRTRQGKLYDRQRDRLVFPYCDSADAAAGKPAAISGFAGRRMGEDDGRSPKWLNSVNMPGVWEKKSALIGLYQAAVLIAAESRVAVGEGAWEMLAFDRVDAPCVGLVSASLNQLHVEVLARYGAASVTVAFDGDTTGRDGTIAAAVELLKYGYALERVTAIDCPDGTDPADLAAYDLRDRWDHPLALLAFCRAHPDAGKSHARSELLKLLPFDAANDLRALWGLAPLAPQPTDKPALDNRLPVQRFVSQLVTQPDAAQHLAQADIDEMIDGDTLAQSHVEALTFGEYTDLSQLPPTLRRAWLGAQHHVVDKAITAHDKSDMFGEAGTVGAFQSWFKRGEDLRARAVTLRKTLDETCTGE